MPTPTRTTVAVAIAFLLFAAYGACVKALDASMYSALLAMPHASTVGTVAIVVAVLGLVHLVWTRCAPSPTLCLVLLVAEVVCASVLLAYAVAALSTTTHAIDDSPKLTTYQHRMEEFLASDAARQYKYSSSLTYTWGVDAPSRPTLSYVGYEYPRTVARMFNDVYCMSEGRHFCSAFPLVQTIVFPGLWADPNVTAAIARNLSTLPTTFANVTVTATTTIESFCARVNISYTIPRDQTEPFMRDLGRLCSSCKTLGTLATVSTDHDTLKQWIHTSCPMTSPKPSGVYCVTAADCIQTNVLRPERSDDSEWCYVTESYLNPSYDACFGHTLMSAARTYAVAIVIASGVLLCLSVLLLARVYVVRQVQRYQDALREAAVQTPTMTNV
ncbi:hypothetical protein SPRG_22206 [Saprolegnia parasitica CBS 223.65]|uniref:Uncharacterized protein n=1 Tax=Saprolegnia parasitica (strain CBS 223.65) TaxID=695850 RepID=A0A067C885_SAPPC|nr:hypothetical protein SPRG_22206 [Saprolegnia parasitica CBS 223.65]KDO26678.1 hypothetical protein SPRG_22206 [Saprolegnia parasitica CBS 223.65]|eukprot:XP_012202633.1 hypothetical protein SPRG_22206 [Saprolegnia parasitica CBS 223.65]